MIFDAVLLTCGHTVVLVPPDTPESKLPTNGIWTKSRPIDGRLTCPDDAHVYRVVDA